MHTLPRFDLQFRSRARFALAGTAETPWGLCGSQMRFYVISGPATP